MPTYGYACGDCGPFELVRPMADYAQDQPCPACNAMAARALLAVPALGSMEAGRRAAFATNERSANLPRRSGGRHSARCGCCTGPAKSLRVESTAAPVAKAFSTRRPWMISH